MNAEWEWTWEWGDHNDNGDDGVEYRYFGAYTNSPKDLDLKVTTLTLKTVNDHLINTS